MRQIKFRIYNKSQHEMIVDSLNHYIAMQGAIWWQFGYEDIVPVNQDDYILMQWTGLLDKNGVEIYDGDLMRVKMLAIVYSQEKWDGNEIYYTDVEQSPAAEIIAEVRINPKHTVLMARKIISGTLATKSTRLKIRKADEVIGNIWENPELLK